MKRGEKNWEESDASTGNPDLLTATFEEMSKTKPPNLRRRHGFTDTFHIGHAGGKLATKTGMEALR